MSLTEPRPWGHSYVEAACNETWEQIPENGTVGDQNRICLLSSGLDI